MKKQNKKLKELDKINKFPKTVEEDLKLIKESELLKEERKLHPLLKRAMILFASLVIVFLFLSLIYLQYPLFNVIQGQIESKSPNNNILQLKNFNIDFTDDAIKIMQTSFKDNKDVETSLCLKGELKDKTYFINEIYAPKIYEQSLKHVSSEPCSNTTLIMFHTHPYKSCIASTTDLYTLKSTQQTNPNIIMIIMCEPDRFSTYE
jgi:proteasome lid subunit RPN8/RPN11